MNSPKKNLRWCLWESYNKKKDHCRPKSYVVYTQEIDRARWKRNLTVMLNAPFLPSSLWFPRSSKSLCCFCMWRFYGILFLLLQLWSIHKSFHSPHCHGIFEKKKFFVLGNKTIWEINFLRMDGESYL